MINRVLIIVPCYNEEKNIEIVVNNISNQISILKDSHPHIQIDYILINDCSKDGTVSLCKRHNYSFLSLPVNLGIGGGVQAGYLYASEREYDIAVQHDGDGQHDPKYFLDVITPILSGEYDIVIGSRFITKEGFQSNRIRRLGIMFLSTLIKICTRTHVLDVTSGYRAVNRKFIEYFACNYAQDYPEPEAITSAALNGAKITEIPVIMHERIHGTSSISPLKSVLYMTKVTLSILLHRISISGKELNSNG